MAKTQTAKTRNTERRSGKAWGKHHNPTVEEIRRAQERDGRRKEKRAAREKRVVVHGERGLNITMPQINWEWATETMRARWPNTRKLRVIDAYIALGKAAPKTEDGVPVVSVMDNTEVKASRRAASSRKNGR